MFENHEHLKHLFKWKIILASAPTQTLVLSWQSSLSFAVVFFTYSHRSQIKDIIKSIIQTSETASKLKVSDREMTIRCNSRATEKAGDYNELFFETGVTKKPKGHKNLVWKCTQLRLITGVKQKCGEREIPACICHRFHRPQRRGLKQQRWFCFKVQNGWKPMHDTQKKGHKWERKREKPCANRTPINQHTFWMSMMSTEW